MTIDRKLSFEKHTQAVTEKARRTVKALSYLLPNIGDPKMKKSKIMCSVDQSVLLYGAPIWHTAMKITRYKEIMKPTQRLMALRICG